MASSDGPSPKPTKLVTFLGKGGSGKTTAAAIAAQDSGRRAWGVAGDGFQIFGIGYRKLGGVSWK
ncbi:Uncharacterized protein QJS10_CPB14g00213 [Acorus calamus]|uniref:Anion-transporting ATPase-like domain-containing protein n=1 Tax=Acorus calamus TaxID=4465 RepID=A0AAV9DE20_ACOCL|nr:Uncharacterized protein QJS10_CPB14g00213 [Acorus calamus]